MGDAYDYFDAMLGGMHGGIDSHLLPPNMYWRGLNVWTRDGHVHTRPGYTSWMFSADTPYDLQVRFGKGRYQGAAVYTSATSCWLMVMVSGRLYKINTIDYTLTDLSASSGYTLDENVERCFFCQCERYMVIQDGINDALICEGAIVRRPVRDSESPHLVYEVPIGTIMAFGQGRLFIKAGEQFFLAGNMWLPNDPSNVLDFTEKDYMQGGGALGVPENLGEITGMRFVQNVHTGSGSGNMIVFCRNGATAFDLSPDRTMWTDTTTQLSSVMFGEHGCVGPDASFPVNQDMVYRSWDGIRSIRLTQTEIESMWFGLLGTRTISYEMQPYLKRELPETPLRLISGATWNNLLFMTGNGIKCKALNNANEEIDDWAFEGMYVMDFANVSTVSEKLKPTWAGMWARDPVLQVFKATYLKERLFMVCKNQKGYNCINEVVPGTYMDDVDRIYCEVQTRGFYFTKPEEQGEFMVKRWLMAEGWFEEIQGKVDVSLLWKSDDYPVWLPNSSRFMCAPQSGESELAGKPQARSRISFGAPPVYCHPSTGQQINAGFIFEFLLIWNGSMKIHGIRFKAQGIPLPPEDRSHEETCISVLNQVPAVVPSSSAFTSPEIYNQPIWNNQPGVIIPENPWIYWDFPYYPPVPPNPLLPGIIGGGGGGSGGAVTAGFGGGYGIGSPHPKPPVPKPKPGPYPIWDPDKGKEASGGNPGAVGLTPACERWVCEYIPVYDAENPTCLVWEFVRSYKRSCDSDPAQEVPPAYAPVAAPGVGPIFGGLLPGYIDLSGIANGDPGLVVGPAGTLKDPLPDTPNCDDMLPYDLPCIDPDDVKADILDRIWLNETECHNNVPTTFSNVYHNVALKNWGLCGCQLGGSQQAGWYWKTRTIYHAP